MPATAALPTLSDVRAFNGDYLVDAAKLWSETSHKWVDAQDSLMRDVVRPADTEWTGMAADSAVLRVGSDRRRVTSAADDLSAAASVARRAAGDLCAAKTKLLNTVRAAEAAGFEVGDDFSLTTVESTRSAKELAAREAQMRGFGIRIRADVLGLVQADEHAATQIADAAGGLRSLPFYSDDGGISERAAIQAVDFHGIPLPEKPPYPPAIPPPEGWSSDPVMRAVQKIAYGHAYDKHRADFPELTQEQLAQVIHKKMQRSMSDPSGLTLGLSKSDRVPVIYDPEDNLLIVRDARPNAPDGGTVFKAPTHGYADSKIRSYVSIFTPEQLADGPVAPAPPGNSAGNGVVAPSQLQAEQAATAGSQLPGDRGLMQDSVEDWGTYVPPEELAKTDGPLGILGRIILGQAPDPHDPDNWA